MTLDPGEVATDINIGNRLAPGGIQGQKWNDLDGDGVKEEGEPRLPDWTIFIDTDADGELDDGERSTTTDSAGSYFFGDLIPGNYTLAEVQQAGWIDSHSPNSVTVNPNQVTGDADFGNYALPALQGDFNRNGEVDAADYVLWRRTIGSSPPAYMGADGTGDGTVASDDYDVWRGHFGNTAPPAGEATAAVSKSATDQMDAAKQFVIQGISTLRSSTAANLANRRSSVLANRTTAFIEAAGDFERSHDAALLEWLSAGLAPKLVIDRDVVDEISSEDITGINSRTMATRVPSCNRDGPEPLEADT